MAKENLCLENEQGTKHTEEAWEVRKKGRQPLHSNLGSTGCRAFQEERAWSALLRAAGGQGLEASFEMNDLIAVQVSIRNSRKAEAAVILRLGSHGRPYKLLHDLVGDRMRMEARKGKGVTGSEQQDG